MSVSIEEVGCCVETVKAEVLYPGDFFLAAGDVLYKALYKARGDITATRAKDNTRRGFRADEVVTLVDVRIEYAKRTV